MRRRTKFNINPKHLFIFSIVFCLILIFVSFQYSETLAPVKSVVGGVLTPMQKGINSIGDAIANQGDKFTSLNKLLKENANLKENINNLTYDNKILLQDKYELDRFRELYKLDKKYADYPKVGAKVISADPNNLYTTFSVDKGTEDGIEVDMNVISGNGLVGRVMEAHKNYSIVRSIIDDSSSISGMFIKTSDTCMVNGDMELYNDGVIGVELIGKDAQVFDGYEVVTSHISPKYLQGILIGYISDIKVDPNNLTKTALLTPAVNFDRLDEVLIITELKQKLEE
ncbi:MAG: putative rane protein [Anaerocolumna sp.]|jgi:rod shape-determining protein MreC|nr:putative rane protein [Anaerocolumna sp.]